MSVVALIDCVEPATAAFMASVPPLSASELDGLRIEVGAEAVKSSWTVPALIVVVPVKVLAAVRLSVPRPVLVRPAEPPEIAPEIVSVPLLATLKVCVVSSVIGMASVCVAVD